MYKAVQISLHDSKKMESFGRSDKGSGREKKGVNLKNSKAIEWGREEKNMRAEIERTGLGKCQGDRRRIERKWEWWSKGRV